MTQKRWKELFEATGLVAIVASLIFVGFQLRQEQIIARSELTSESFSLMIGLSETLTDPEFAPTYAKMLDRPEDLTVSEMVQIDNLLESIIKIYQRECYLVDRGIFVECDAIVRVTADQFFGNKHAQTWWRMRKPEGIPDWVDSYIANLDTNSYRRRLDEVREGL